MKIQDSIAVEPQIYDDNEKLVCYDSTSQYAVGGVSACGLASLNFARIIFEKENSGLHDNELIRALVSEECIMDVVSVCQAWPAQQHLEVEKLMEAPIFQSSLKGTECTYGIPSVSNLEMLLGTLQRNSANAQSSSVAVITRPPEVLACALTPKNIFLVFDSHSRPTHPNGSGLFLTSSLERVAQYLHEIFYVDPSIVTDPGFQWQTQLLSNFSAHIFVSRSPTLLDSISTSQLLLKCSIELLALRSQVADLTVQNQQLIENAEKRNAELAVLRREYGILRQFKDSKPQYNKQSPEGPSSYSKVEYNHKGKQRVQNNSNLPAWKTTPTYQKINTASGQSYNSHVSTRPHDEKNRSRQSSSSTYASALKFAGNDCSVDGSAALARKMQQDFDAESAQIEADRQLVKLSVQVTFKCGICLEILPEDDATEMAGCDHTTCRECLREYVVSTLGEHRYPIFCPGCVGEAEKSEITQDVIAVLGIPEKMYHIFEELQISAFSVLMHCRKCKHDMFIDKDQYQDSKIVTCPLPKCTHSWCKECQQTITPNVAGPPHSCDGTSELEHLMKEQGWKYCPGCKTPVMKISGCHHMTCMSSGCNTHFCYKCGANIVQSALGKEVQDAVKRHYGGKCVLFEVPVGAA